MKTHSFCLALLLCLIGFCTSCNSGDKSSVKEWAVSCAQDQEGNYEWEGTLYCNEEGINWKHNDANEFLGQYLPNGNHWTVKKDEFKFIGLGDTVMNGSGSSYIEINTVNSKQYYIKAADSKENKKLLDYLVDTYMN